MEGTQLRVYWACVAVFVFGGRFLFKYPLAASPFKIRDGAIKSREKRTTMLSDNIQPTHGSCTLASLPCFIFPFIRLQPVSSYSFLITGIPEVAARSVYKTLRLADRYRALRVLD